MHALANLGPGELTPFPQPGIRKIGFEENPSQITVARLLVQSWTVHRETQECTDPPCGDFDSFAKSTRHLTRQEREQLPQNPETSTVHTPWRGQIYHMWNHVFFDVGNFMANLYGTATFLPPNTDAFGIEFPAAEDEKGFVVEKVWESEMLLAAAYLAPGVSVRLESITPGRENEEPFHASDINHEARHNVWYVRKGIKVRFCVEGERQEGLAAVIVFAPMLGAPVEPSSDEEEEESEEEESDK